jgi:RNA polymerase sigma-70 factor (ECF subfamily)
VELEMTKKLSIAQERELVVWAQAGSRSAMQDLLEAHRPTMTRLARRMLRDGEDVSDAVQEAMLKAARAIQSFDSTRPFAPWLMRITSNCCVDLIRSASQRPDSLDAYDTPVADASADVQCSTETAMLAEALEEAIQRLPERYRSIVEMRHYRHMEVLEIAQELGKPEGTIKSWLFRARALLKVSLQPAMSEGALA